MTRTYVFKCEWRATSVTIKVEARNPSQAEYKAWGTVSRMQGGECCEKVTLKEVR